jgi:hypothetical protein
MDDPVTWMTGCGPIRSLMTCEACMLREILSKMLCVRQCVYDMRTMVNRTGEQLGKIESGPHAATSDGAAMASYAYRTPNIVCIAVLKSFSGGSYLDIEFLIKEVTTIIINLFIVIQ